MKKMIILLLPALLFSASPFETSVPKSFNTSVFETKETKENTQASKNSKITCKYVCDKRVYTEQKISDAVEFYKKTREYDLSSY